MQHFNESWLEGLDDPQRHAVCMYTLSPDLHPIAGLHPELPHVSFAAGMSGHGFKFSSAFGEALADLASEGATNLPMDIFNPARLKEGS